MVEVGHRVAGEPQAIVDEDQVRNTSIISQTKHLHHPKKADLMRELFPEGGKSSSPMTDQAKKGIEYQGNVGAYEL